MSSTGFRLGIYVFKDAEIVDFAAPYGVFSVARRFDPELDAFFVADAMRPVQAQAGFTVLPNSSFLDRPAMDAFLIPGGFGTRQEMHNRRLHEFIRELPDETLLTSVCTGSWVYGVMGLLDGLAATNRKEPDRLEAGPNGKTPIDRLADLAPAARISRARVVDAGRIITANDLPVVGCEPRELARFAAEEPVRFALREFALPVFDRLGHAARALVHTCLPRPSASQVPVAARGIL